MLSVPRRPFQFEMSFAWLAEHFATIWQPFLLGTVTAKIGYVGLDLLWVASISDYLARQCSRRKG